MSTKIVKIVFEVSGKEIELTEDEAKELKLVLDGLYGAPLQYIPQPYPVYTPNPLPIYPPILPPQPSTPYPFSFQSNYIGEVIPHPFVTICDLSELSMVHD